MAKKETIVALEAEIKSLSEANKLNLTGSQIKACVEEVLGGVEATVAKIQEGDMVEVDVGAVLGVNQTFDLDTVDGETMSVEEGNFIVVNAGETVGLLSLDIYDADSNLIETGVVIIEDEIDDLVEYGVVEIIPADQIEYDDGTDTTEGVEEAFIKFTHGKMKRFKLAAKKGFKRVGGRYVKISAQTIAKMKRNALKAGRKAQMGSAKMFRKKTMRIRKMKMHDSFDYAKGYAVAEGFDVIIGIGQKLMLEGGDVVSFENNGTIGMNIVRDGKHIANGVVVDESFIKGCISELLIKESEGEEAPEEAPEVTPEEAPEVAPEVTPEVAPEGEEVAPEGEEVTPEVAPEVTEEEAEEVAEVAESFLTFKNNKGYVLTKEGNEQVLGNRVRARAFLLSEGYTVNSVTLDTAFNGKKVTL